MNKMSDTHLTQKKKKERKSLQKSEISLQKRKKSLQKSEILLQKEWKLIILHSHSKTCCPQITLSRVKITFKNENYSFRVKKITLSRVTFHSFGVTFTPFWSESKLFKSDFYSFLNGVSLILFTLSHLESRSKSKYINVNHVMRQVYYQL